MNEFDGFQQVAAPDPTEAAVGKSFRCGFVALAGRANVGKSTLLNQLLGSKVAIVSTVPQTTRFPVRGVLHRPGLQVIVIDTPGIHKPRYRMNEEMVRMATRILKEVDLVAVIVDASEGLGPGDRFVFDQVKQAGIGSFLVLNKIDLMPKERLLLMIDEARKTGLFEEIIPLSALTGENCDRLERVITERMPEGPPHFPPETLSDLPERLAIAELIREQVFVKTRQEVPHATAVLIEAVRKDEKGLTRIDATILVDRDSQKSILIGEGGGMMKAIGTAARHNLETLLKGRVHLSLWVKVKEGWRDDPALLRLIGLPVP